jgi:hypothetical protein
MSTFRNISILISIDTCRTCRTFKNIHLSTRSIISILEFGELPVISYKIDIYEGSESIEFNSMFFFLEHILKQILKERKEQKISEIFTSFRDGTGVNSLE